MGDAPKLLDRVRDMIRSRHYSRRTEEAYVLWIRRYIVYRRKVHPSRLGAEAIAAFLTWLAVDRRVSASTQNQALSALLFLIGTCCGSKWGQSTTFLESEAGAVQQPDDDPRHAGTSVTFAWATVGWSCRPPSNASIRMRRWCGGGSSCFRRGVFAAMRDGGRHPDSICMSRPFNGRSRRRPCAPV
jgi:hypothetical protein